MGICAFPLLGRGHSTQGTLSICAVFPSSPAKKRRTLVFLASRGQSHPCECATTVHDPTSPTESGANPRTHLASKRMNFRIGYCCIRAARVTASATALLKMRREYFSVSSTQQDAVDSSGSGIYFAAALWAAELARSGLVFLLMALDKVQTAANPAA